MQSDWQGVFPAITTPFMENGHIDFDFFQNHVQTLLEAGVHGMVVCGTLGEASTLSHAEKLDLIRHAKRVCRERVPVLAGVAENSTTAAQEFVGQAAEAGADGIMLLPPMQYAPGARETEIYLRSVAEVSPVPIMLYNNPVTYKTDISPEMFARLADEPKFVAIKESSDDVRRITDIRNLTGKRYRLFIGVDDLALEALAAGADGWVAGLVCAFPRETVALYELARAGRLEQARELYRWFMPLLHLDASAKLVQNIKLAQAMVGLGSETVRPPRLSLTDAERERVRATISQALANRPDLSRWGFKP
ncbi:MAG: dihydrodipicolinate synthase family protein [candidate division KSB1 bacterium]|nr:dihydrodipicolinate synthase family protein [candidate division KSB1 bacterium]MDQ7065704.1 dihydrodipicolinate synthase family protein [candidate division KSB1 bacterium]